MSLIASETACADTWAVYLYLCGSDLERRLGAASTDLTEIMKARYGSDVTVVVETGGTKEWKKLNISASRLERYVVRNGKLNRVANLPQASMGKGETLKDFISFCLKNYNADHKILILWDHGGGSAGRFCSDENFNEGLTLPQLRKVLTKVITADEKNPPFEIIGFDACLMATLDTANAVRGFCRYMIASQETEPKLGWEYTGWLSALGANTAMSGAQLARQICDTYYSACKKGNVGETVTLSVLDMAKFPAVSLYWNILGVEAAEKISDDTSYFAVMSRYANKSENYCNIKGKSCTNMVDMGSFVAFLKKDLTTFAEDMEKKLREAILYQVSGSDRKPSGLSFYFPLDGGKSYKSVLALGDPTSFLILQGLQTGKISAEKAESSMEKLLNRLEKESAHLDEEEEDLKPGTQTKPGHLVAAQDVQDITSHIQRSTPASNTQPKPGHLAAAQDILDITAQVQTSTPTSNTQPVLAQFGWQSTTAGVRAMQLKPVEMTSIQDFKDVPITIGDDGAVTMQIDPAKLQYLDSVNAYLTTYDSETNMLTYLGSDADLDADWKKGLFKDNFRNKWPALDGHILLLETVRIDGDTYRYQSPIKINGDRYMLEFAYDFSVKKFRILGARQFLSDDQPDKVLKKLMPGDTITTRLSLTKLARDTPIEEVDIDTFTFTEQSAINEKYLGDGDYFFLFELIDVRGQKTTSGVAYISVKDGKVEKM